MPWIRGFIWDDENVAHIGRHQVSPDEVEEALTGSPVILRGPDGRYLVYGRTAAGRLLFAVYVQRPEGRIRILTAREMTEKEKRFYRKKRKGRG
jgi:hypothetical protein